jgi:tetraacyldisaccharide 4'-kinase
MLVCGRAQRPVLIPISWLFGFIVRLRNFLFDTGILKSVRFTFPVISVGNITVGGTGKTPHVEYLIKLLKNDYCIAILSRGYKRKTNNFIISSEMSTAREIGDEPKQIKSKFPGIHVAVDEKRVAGITALRKLIPNLDLVILDDAYQHRQIVPGFSIVLIDYNRPVFKDMMLPAGNLREPSKNIRRADIIIITKCPEDITPELKHNFIAKLNPGSTQHIFFTTYVYGQIHPVFGNPQNRNVDISDLAKNHYGILLVTGIANPRPLRRYLVTLVPLSDELVFPDHHQFSENDILLIQKKLNNLKASAKIILVTEKDAIRIRESSVPEALKKSIYYVPIEVRFLGGEESRFNRLVHHYLDNALKI